MVVTNVERRRGRQSNRIRGNEVGRSERADVDRPSGLGGVKYELLDRRIRTGMVDDEEVGRRPNFRRVHLHAEWVEVVAFGVVIQRDRVQRTRFSGVQPQECEWLRVTQGTHDSVPCFSVGIASKEDESMCQTILFVEVVPESDILTVVDRVGCLVPDNSTAFLVITTYVVRLREAREA